MKRPRAGYIATMYIETPWRTWIIGGRWLGALLLASSGLAATEYRLAAATPQAPVLTLQQSLQRVGKVYTFDCGSREAGTALIEIYDVLNQHPYWTTTIALSQMPLTQAVYSGGPAIVYIKITCTAASGASPPKSAIYKFHYPDAPLLLAPSAPTSIKVI